MTAAFRYERYGWRGGSEWMLAYGAMDGPQALILSPLFEEHNFTRAMTVALARNLAGAGIGSWIADLPGIGESETPLTDISLVDWRDAARSAGATIRDRTRHVPHILSLRGGALVDDAVDGASWWRFAATRGAPLIRLLERAQAIGDREAGTVAVEAETIELVGYRMTAAFRDVLRNLSPVPPAGTLRDMAFDGPGLAPWRRAEPGRDDALARRLADDAGRWIARCAI